mgnify:CR=1 FL=1
MIIIRASQRSQKKIEFLKNSSLNIDIFCWSFSDSKESLNSIIWYCLILPKRRCLLNSSDFLQFSSPYTGLVCLGNAYST